MANLAGQAKISSGHIWPTGRMLCMPGLEDRLPVEINFLSPPISVNFTNIIRAAFSYESFVRSFFVLRFKVYTFWVQKYQRKSCT